MTENKAAGKRIYSHTWQRKTIIITSAIVFTVKSDLTTQTTVIENLLLKKKKCKDR